MFIQTYYSMLHGCGLKITHLMNNKAIVQNFGLSPRQLISSWYVGEVFQVECMGVNVSTCYVFYLMKSHSIMT